MTGVWHSDLDLDDVTGFDPSVSLILAVYLAFEGVKKNHVFYVLIGAKNIHVL